MFAAGTKLGAYQIVAQIGAGGMGEVYRARDTRLDRMVAIKVLPAHLADKPELRERFEREARTIASLNHPHICTLYDIGQLDGIDFLVMEYLEGETLAQRLLKGALPLDQMLQYAIEIADALDKAHRKGVTHRDLKPGNIMLTKAGTKLLDFGLAKLKQEAAPDTPFSQLPTAAVKDAVTQQGTILGTLEYMAPEQVEGKVNQADARTDIFAFGAVVYEMATGKKAFEGKTQASVMAKILESEPPSMTSLQPMTPPVLDRVVKKCLAKEPDRRWQDASDLCDELKWVADSGGTHGVAVEAPAATGKNWRKAALWAGVAVATCIVVGFAVWLLKPASPKLVTRFTISLPPGQRLNINESAVAISPDGTRLVYSSGPNTLSSQLYLRAMDGLEARAIPGTEGGGNPFFSPDGQWIGFTFVGKIMKVPLSGGAPVLLEDIFGFYGASWGSHGAIAVAGLPTGPIEQVPETGAYAQSSRFLTHLQEHDVAHRWPEFLPGDKGLLFTAFRGLQGRIAAQTLGTGDQRELVPSGLSPRYAASGHLVYLQGANLMAAPFDLQRLATTGAPAPVIEGVLAARGIAQYSFSSTGTLVYVPGANQEAGLKLVWVDRKGGEQPLPAPAHNYVLPKVSPDGKRVAVGIEEVDSQTWVYDLDRDTLTRLTFEGSANIDPLWTPDGKRIVFKGARNRLFWQPADGSAGAEELTKAELAENNVPGGWTPDGQVLVFMEVNPKTSFDVYTLSLKDSKPQPFVNTASVETLFAGWTLYRLRFG